jgi:nitrate reductase NapE component
MCAKPILFGKNGEMRKTILRKTPMICLIIIATACIALGLVSGFGFLIWLAFWGAVQCDNLFTVLAFGAFVWILVAMNWCGVAVAVLYRIKHWPFILLLMQLALVVAYLLFEMNVAQTTCLSDVSGQEAIVGQEVANLCFCEAAIVGMLLIFT